MLLRESFTNYLTYLDVELGRSSETIRSYRKGFNNFLLCFKNYRYVEDLKEEDLETFIAYLRKQGYKDATILLYISAMKNFSKYMNSNDLTPIVFEAENKPPVPEKNPRVMTKEQIRIIIGTPKGKDYCSLRDKTFMYFLYASGIRVMEAYMLKTRDFRWDDNSVHIHGKGAKDRIVPLTRNCMEIMHEFIYNIRPRAVYQADGDDIGYVFLSRKGTHWHHRKMREAIYKYAEQAGFKERVSPHVFRHSYASHLVDNGCPIEVVAKLLGHETVASTDVYTHVSQRRIVDEYDKIVGTSDVDYIAEYRKIADQKKDL